MNELEKKFKTEVMKIYEKSLTANRLPFKEYIPLLYWNLFGQTGQIYTVGVVDNKVYIENIHDRILEVQNEYLHGVRTYPNPGQLDIISLFENEEFKSKVIAGVELGRVGNIYLWNNVIVFLSNQKSRVNITLLVKDQTEAEEFIKILKTLRLDNRRKNMYTFLIKSDEGLKERKLLFDDQLVDLKKNYNDDLPWNELMRFIKDDHEGISILYGPAGTGKTTLIKKLIQESPDKNFVLVNSKDLESPDSECYLEYFLEEENRIFILEDCEKLLLTRNRGGGSNQLATILNMTDGLLGNTLKTKFIGTFNTDLRNIDEALLRRGRLKVKYYVGPLCLEKTRELARDPSINKEMTLAEIYNKEENDFSKNSGKKIGF